MVSGFSTSKSAGHLVGAVTCLKMSFLKTALLSVVQVIALRTLKFNPQLIFFTFYTAISDSYGDKHWIHEKRK